MLSRSSACAQRAPSRLRVPLALRTHKLSSSSQGHETAQPSAVPLLSDDRIVVQPSYNRWVQLAPTTLAGLSIGAYFTVPGVLGPGLCKAQGVVAQAATDFSMSTLVPTLTLMPLVAATLAATLAKTSDEVGVRRLGLAASIVYPLGVYVLPAAAVAANSLAAFAPCYAVIGGIGFFAGYPQIPPFLLRWFPDRKGLALSLYGATFGAGRSSSHWPRPCQGYSAWRFDHALPSLHLNMAYFRFFSPLLRPVDRSSAAILQACTHAAWLVGGGGDIHERGDGWPCSNVRWEGMRSRRCHCQRPDGDRWATRCAPTHARRRTLSLLTCCHMTQSVITPSLRASHRSVSQQPGPLLVVVDLTRMPTPKQALHSSSQVCFFSMAPTELARRWLLLVES